MLAVPATYDQEMSRRDDPVSSITSAAPSLHEDQARRARRYLVQMGIRVVCFLTAVIGWGHFPLGVEIALLVGAVVLPYSAVLLANAGRERGGKVAAPTPPAPAQLPPGTGALDSETATAPGPTPANPATEDEV